MSVAPMLTRERAPGVVQAAVSERDAIQANLLELETKGYTVVRGVLSAEQIARARAAILNRVEKITGRRLDPDTASAEDFLGMQYLPYLLFEDDAHKSALVAACARRRCGFRYLALAGRLRATHGADRGFPGPSPAPRSRRCARLGPHQGETWTRFDVNRQT